MLKYVTAFQMHFVDCFVVQYYMTIHNHDTQTSVSEFDCMEDELVESYNVVALYLLLMTMLL